MKTTKKTQFKIVKIGGRSRRVSIDNYGLGNLVGGFISIIVVVAVSSMALATVTNSLGKVGLLDPTSQSEVRGRAREAARV